VSRVLPFEEPEKGKKNDFRGEKARVTLYRDYAKDTTSLSGCGIPERA
jgi:hypothetical protein